MTADEHAATAQRFLQHADSYFAAGDDLQGSEKLWGAAVHAVTAVEKDRGWRFRNYTAHKDAVRSLAAETGVNDLSKWFLEANKLHVNFYLGHMNRQNIESRLPMVLQQVLAIREQK